MYKGNTKDLVDLIFFSLGYSPPFLCQGDGVGMVNHFHTIMNRDGSLAGLVI